MPRVSFHKAPINVSTIPVSRVRDKLFHLGKKMLVVLHPHTLPTNPARKKETTTQFFFRSSSPICVWLPTQYSIIRRVQLPSLRRTPVCVNVSHKISPHQIELTETLPKCSGGVRQPQIEAKDFRNKS